MRVKAEILEARKHGNDVWIYRASQNTNEPRRGLEVVSTSILAEIFAIDQPDHVKEAMDLALLEWLRANYGIKDMPHIRRQSGVGMWLDCGKPKSPPVVRG